MSLVDENAFGILIGYFGIEDEEYALEREAFVTRFTEFRTCVLDYVATIGVCENGTVLDFGHALYVEFADGDQLEDPLSWAKALRALLSGREFASVVVVAHGSRWIEEDGDAIPEVGELGNALRFAQLSRPSEPLRRALAAEACSRTSDEAVESGWGPGLYIDTEAVEALGRSLKNAPTPLAANGASFYRAGR